MRDTKPGPPQKQESGNAQNLLQAKAAHVAELADALDSGSSE